MNRLRHVRKGVKLSCLAPPCVHHPGSSLNSALLEFLWRLHYLDMISSIIGLWRLIQLPTPLPSLEIGGWDIIGSPENPPPPLGAFQKPSD